MIIPLLYYR